MIKVFAVFGLSLVARQELQQHVQQCLSPAVLTNLEQADVMNQSACLCCQTHNETSQRLRELFMQALHKKIPVFSSVVCACGTQVEGNSVRYTVEHDFFLKARFTWAGGLLAIDQELVQKIISASQLSDEQSLFPEKLIPFLSLFLASQIGVYTENSFSNETIKHDFCIAVQQIYTYLNLFQTTQKALPLVSLQQLNKEQLGQLQQQQQQVIKRHLFI